MAALGASETTAMLCSVPVSRPKLPDILSSHLEKTIHDLGSLRFQDVTLASARGHHAIAVYENTREEGISKLLAIFCGKEVNWKTRKRSTFTSSPGNTRDQRIPCDLSQQPASTANAGNGCMNLKITEMSGGGSPLTARGPKPREW